MKKAFLKLGILACMMSLVSTVAHAKGEMTKIQALKVLNALMSSRTIVQTFGGKYSTQTVATKNAEITLTMTQDGTHFLINIGSNNPVIDNLDTVLVDGATLRSVL